MINSALAIASKRPPMADGSIKIYPEDIDDGLNQDEGSPDPLAPLDTLYRYSQTSANDLFSIVITW